MSAFWYQNFSLPRLSWQKTITNNTTIVLKYFHCFHLWKSNLFRQEKNMPRLILQLEEAQQRQMIWSIICLVKKCSFSAPALQRHPRLSGQASLCSACSLQSRDDGMCWPPAETCQIYSLPKFSSQDFSQLGTYQLSPFHFAWVSIDGASSSWERWTLITEHCSSQLLQSKVKCSLMSQKATVKVSATDLTRKLMSSHRTWCAKTKGA